MLPYCRLYTVLRPFFLLCSGWFYDVIGDIGARRCMVNSCKIQNWSTKLTIVEFPITNPLSGGRCAQSVLLWFRYLELTSSLVKSFSFIHLPYYRTTSHPCQFSVLKWCPCQTYLNLELSSCSQSDFCLLFSRRLKNLALEARSVCPLVWMHPKIPVTVRHNQNAFWLSMTTCTPSWPKSYT